MRRLRLSQISCVLVFSFLHVLDLSAATFNPVTVLDLITAITLANVNGESDTIDLGNGTFTLTAVNFTDSRGPDGLPAIAADLGNSILIKNGTIARSSAGGTPNFRILRTSLGATLSVDGVTFRNGNPGSSNGGALLNLGTIALVNNSTFDGNFSLNGSGIFNFGTVTTVSNSTFLNGIATADGGGILNFGVIVTISNCTFNGNSAGIQGGGIANDFGFITNLTNSTLSNNQAVFHGGGLSNAFGNIVNFVSNIVALNSAEIGVDIVNDVTFFNGLIVNESYNLIGNNDNSGIAVGLPNANHSYVGTTNATIDPLLGSLANNGGVTMTQSLLPGSPAIDKGNNPLALAYDQRGTGYARTALAQTDIGAYEVPAPPPPETLCNDGLDNDADGQFDCGDSDCLPLLICQPTPVVWTPTTNAQLIAAINSANTNKTDDVIDLLGATLTLTAVDNTTTGPNGLPVIGPDNSSGAPHQVLFRNGTIKRSTLIGTPNFRIFEVAANARLSMHMMALISGDPGAAQNGGAILVNALGRLPLVSNTVFNDNHAANNGGGIANNGVIDLIRNSTFSANSAILGGAVYSNNSVGIMVNNTLFGNSADNGGAIAIVTPGVSTYIVNSTISGNTANINGGGIYNTGTIVTLRNSTIASNTAVTSGGGIHNGNIINEITSTIIALDTAPSGPDLYNSNSLIRFLGLESFNLIGNNADSGIASGSPNLNGSFVGTSVSPINPLLGALANNGGTVNTRALLPGSPAIDAGNNPSPMVPLDQRGPGFFRVSNGRADIGAYEVQVAQ